MFFRIIVIAFMLSGFSFANAQVTVSNMNSKPGNNISILTNSYLGFDVLEMHVVDRVRQLLNDSSTVVEMLIPATDTSRLYLRIARLSFNPFRYPVDSMKLIMYESAHRSQNGRIDTSLVFQAIGYIKGETALSNAKAEFKRISKDVDRYLEFVRYNKNSKKDKAQWEEEYYSKPGLSHTNVRVAWSKISETQASIFIGFAFPIIPTASVE